VRELKSIATGHPNRPKGKIGRREDVAKLGVAGQLHFAMTHAIGGFGYLEPGTIKGQNPVNITLGS
jgi:hypothetical protein